MMRPAALDAILRLLIVAAPLAAAAGVVVARRPVLRQRMAAVLAGIAAVAGVLLLNVVAAEVGWWAFDGGVETLLGQPLDLVLGWAVLWGVLPTLIDRWPVTHTLAVLAAVDLVAMPFVPGVQLGRWWLVGEVVGLVTVALPAILLGRWTAQRRHLGRRVALQVGTVGALLLGVVPAATLSVGGGAWRGGLLGWLAVQVGAAGVLVAVAGVWEFRVRGQGTPWPWDPPRRVVVSGPYRFVANPMQAGAVLLLLAEAMALASAWPAAIALVAVAFSVTSARLHEHETTGRRLGAAWGAYHAVARDWWPRWRPPEVDAATLWVAADCGPCSELGSWLESRRPVGLEVRPAVDHPGRPLRRVTYETASGFRVGGVEAFAYALEHVDLAWAVVGWTLRLPGLRVVTGAIGDLVGFGPRSGPRSPRDDEEEMTCPTPRTPVGG